MVLCGGCVVKAVVPSICADHQVLCVFLYVEQRDGGSRHHPAPAPELVYPSVSGVGVDISALEYLVVVVPCVVRAGHRSDGYRCAEVAAWYPRVKGGRGVEKTGDVG